jgi:hypothetical protein
MIGALAQVAISFDSLSFCRGEILLEFSLLNFGWRA